MITVDGKGAAFPVKSKLHRDSFENITKKNNFSKNLIN